MLSWVDFLNNLFDKYFIRITLFLQLEEHSNVRYVKRKVWGAC